MNSTLTNWLLISAISLFLHTFAIGQLSGVVKGGINFGYINKEVWQRPDYPEEIKYDQPLIRPILALGLRYTYKKFEFQYSLMYQTKGQGTSVPHVKNFFQTKSPDAIHFMSFPIGINYKIWPKLSVGTSIQPSLYLGGTDNYYESTYWRGWIWSTVLSVQYLLFKQIEFGIEYEHDFTQYYCDGCDDKFYTFRIFTTLLLK